MSEAGSGDAPSIDAAPSSDVGSSSDAGSASNAADLEIAKAAAREAGAIAMRWFGRDMVVEMKAVDQPLTAADLAADAAIRAMLTTARPAYGWLSEESRDSPDRLGRNRVWIVDPIDGTRSFIAGLPEFSVSIGLAEAGRTIAGVVYNPARDELFSAVRGGGAFHERPGSPASRLHVSRGGATVRTLLASRSEIAAGEFAGFGEDWSVGPVGSTAYKLARVAAGAADAFLSRGPKSEWDICAGTLLVLEAGGRVTDLRGGEPRFNGADPYVHGIVATNGLEHDGMLERIARLPPSGRLRHGEEGVE